MATDPVARRFRKSKTQIMACYDEQIRAGNMTKGIVLLEFQVWTDGCTAEVGARVREKGLAPTARCIENVLRGFCFDEPRGGPVKLRVPLLFEPAPPRKRRRR